MQIGRLTPCQMFEIWQPRWKDKVVLLAKDKVGMHNSIKYSKAPTYPDEYYVSGEVVRKCPIEWNGAIECYAVPISELETLERIK